jgi:drug/metabolite transporter (DMT)-like permease
MHKTSTERLARPRWGQILACAAEAGILAFLTWPFWDDGLRGNSYATPAAMAIYGFLFLATCFLLLAGAAPAVTPRRVAIATAWTMPAVMLLKWLLIFGGRWESFHNRMGLGMEILGPIPNYVVDGAIFLGSLAVVFAVRRASPKPRAGVDDPLR